MSKKKIIWLIVIILVAVISGYMLLLMYCNSLTYEECSGWCKRCSSECDPETFGLVYCPIECTSVFNIFKECSEDNELDCSEYTYSNCPEGCSKACISSFCEGTTCTADCEGSGSCY